MNWKRVLKSVALTTVASHPAGAGILSVVNAFLPDSKKLPVNSTGAEVESVIATLSADQRVALYDRLTEVEIVEANNFAASFDAMSKADMAGSSTRPEIAKMMAQTVCYSVVVLVTAVSICLVLDESDALEDLAGIWQLVFVALGTPTLLLRAYFGLRTKEKQSRYAAVNGAIDVGISKGFFSRLGL